MKRNRVFYTAILILAAALFTSCAGYVNYSKQSWPEAFEELHEDMSLRYPFYEWKELNLDDEAERIAREIEKAGEEGDRDEYYRLMRDYVFNYSDGHVFIISKEIEGIETQTEGSFGLGILKLDNGKYIIHYLAEDGSARKAGMGWGDEVVNWNGKSIDEALANIPIIHAEGPSATKETEWLARCALLVRAPLSEQAEVGFVSSGSDDSEAPAIARLTARQDGGEDKEHGRIPLNFPGEPFGTPVESKKLPGGAGLIRIKRFMPTLKCFNVYAAFKTHLSRLMQEGVTDLIIDLRGNGGGLDALVPRMAGHFLTEENFYESISYYDDDTGSFKIVEEETLRIEPEEPHFEGRIILLVDTGTLSTAEGLPMVMQKTGRGVVMGQYGTGGSFGCGISKIYKLPEGVYAGFSPGRSLDAEGRIQVDSDGNMEGGIHPDIQVPINYQNTRDRFIEGRDIMIEAALAYWAE